MRRAASRLFTFIFAAALFFELVPAPARAVETPFFTAVNDMLIELNDETMPFWYEGALYVPDTIFSGTALGITYTRGRDKLSVALYQLGKAVLFDLSLDDPVDADGKKNNRVPIIRGDHVFFPVSLLARHFGVEYSYTRITCGYLVRIKTAGAVLSDTKFIDAANSLFALRYNQYIKANTPDASQGGDAQGGGTQGGSSQGGSESDVPAGETAVYAAFTVTNAAEGERVFAAMQSRGVPITLLFTSESLADCGDLVRRAIARGCSVGLCIDAGDAADALAAVREANELLWAHANCKTRIVYAASGGEAVEDALAQAGYRCFAPQLDYAKRTLSTQQSINALSAAVRARGKRCLLYFGEDTHFAQNAAQIVTTMRAKSCTFAKLTEIV